MATLRTGRLRGQGLGLEFEQGRERALGQSAGSGRGDLFQGEEVQFQELRARGPQGAACDNFAPLGGEVTDVIELLGRQRGSGHVQSFPGLTASGDETLPLSLYGEALWPANLVLASGL